MKIMEFFQIGRSRKARLEELEERMQLMEDEIELLRARNEKLNFSMEVLVRSRLKEAPLGHASQKIA